MASALWKAWRVLVFSPSLASTISTAGDANTARLMSMYADFWKIGLPARQ
jgi:hypothetical protein